METATLISPQFLPESAAARVQNYLAAQGWPVGVEPLTPDASLREYFRIPWRSGHAVVAVYPESFDPTTQPFLDVTGLLQAAHVPVPQVYAVAPEQGLIIQEDCGADTLAMAQQFLRPAEFKAHLDTAIEFLGRIQAATELAQQRGSCAAALAFDEAKLQWELTFFYEHFFGSLRQEQLSYSQAEALKAELTTLAQDLAARPRVLCHRDYHTSNLLIDKTGQLRIIDYQDARLGPVTYDLVSLLLDRVTAPPEGAALRRGRRALLQARQVAGLPALDTEELTWEFHLTTVQRVLKAVGTFSYQTAVRGRGAVYARYIPAMLRVAVDAAQWLGQFPQLRKVLTARARETYT